MNNKVNRIQFPTILMKWNAKLQSAINFKGNLDYEEWVINQQAGADAEMLGGWDFNDTPESFYSNPQQAPSDKEALLEQARAVRILLDEAIADDEFEKASSLQEVLNTLEIKYNKL